MAKKYNVKEDTRNKETSNAVHLNHQHIKNTLDSAKKNSGRKVTEADRKRAIKMIENTENNFNIKGGLKPKDVYLAVEYIAHAGRIQRKSKAAQKNAIHKARKVLAHPAKLIDCVRVMLPAINSLQNSVIANQKAANILQRTLKNHGYKKQDFFKAAEQESKVANQYYKKEIDRFKNDYAKKHSAKSSNAKGGDK